MPTNFHSIPNPAYEVWLTDDSGVRLAQLTTFKSLEASRVINQAGYFSMQMTQSFDTNLIRPDNMVQIWRGPRGGRLGLWQVYLIRRWKFETNGSNQEIEIAGPGINDLLRRRIVAAYAGSSYTTKTDYADDMMKEVVTESLSDSASPTPDAGTRVWSNLSVDYDLSLGPSLTESFAFDTLLTNSGQGALADIAKASKELGTEVFFDIVPDVVTGSSITFIFRTYTGQRGSDVSSTAIFAQEYGNMRNPSLEYDYTDEENYIYATGQGEEDVRRIVQVYDSTRYGQSIWGRMEAEADSRTKQGSEVTQSGYARLNAGRPRIRFSAIPVDTWGTRFGIDWDFGDKVQAKYLNNQFYCFVNAVSISLDDKFNEKVSARLDFEDYI